MNPDQKNQIREAADLSGWLKTPHKICVDGKGYVWRAYTDEDYWSMAPVNPDNSPVPHPRTFYVPESSIDALITQARREAEQSTYREIAKKGGFFIVDPWEADMNDYKNVKIYKIYEAKKAPEDTKLSRFEVIDDTGRVIVYYGEVRLSYQDDGRTLKVFLKGDTK